MGYFIQIHFIVPDEKIRIHSIIMVYKTLKKTDTAHPWVSDM